MNMIVFNPQISWGFLRNSSLQLQASLGMCIASRITRGGSEGEEKRTTGVIFTRYIYIYILIPDTNTWDCVNMCVHMCIYIYVWMCYIHNQSTLTIVLGATKPTSPDHPLTSIHDIGNAHLFQDNPRYLSCAVCWGHGWRSVDGTHGLCSPAW